MIVDSIEKEIAPYRADIEELQRELKRHGKECGACESPHGPPCGIARRYQKMIDDAWDVLRAKVRELRKL